MPSKHQGSSALSIKKPCPRPAHSPPRPGRARRGWGTGACWPGYIDRKICIYIYIYIYIYIDR